MYQSPSATGRRMFRSMLQWLLPVDEVQRCTVTSQCDVRFGVTCMAFGMLQYFTRKRRESLYLSLIVHSVKDSIKNSSRWTWRYVNYESNLTLVPISTLAVAFRIISIDHHSLSESDCSLFVFKRGLRHMTGGIYIGYRISLLAKQ